MHVVIAFDVSDDRSRYRVVKALKGFARRVQKSVFEAVDLDRAAYLRMRSLVERHIEPTTDSVRYYRLCGGCTGQVEHYGAGPGLLDPPDECDVI
jgi:CRISPR-associated protein Cas2